MMISLSKTRLAVRFTSAILSLSVALHHLIKQQNPHKQHRNPATITQKGETCTYINNLGAEVTSDPSGGPATYPDQVASPELLKQLFLDVHTKRPIWTSGVVAKLDEIIASGESISCPHYPHSAEDIALAVKKIRLDMKHKKIGVVSSISPWVEHVLRSEGASSVITVDYNEPIVCSGINWIQSKSVSEFSMEVGTYDLLVSFSGIEHSGLGRYGDPINKKGDIEAMEQMHKALAPCGYLLLGIPTAVATRIPAPWHRIYGIDRLSMMIEKFDLMGRVWDGHVFGGWVDADKVPKLFPNSTELGPVVDWQYQNVLILRKKQCN